MQLPRLQSTFCLHHQLFTPVHCRAKGHSRRCFGPWPDEVWSFALESLQFLENHRCCVYPVISTQFNACLHSSIGVHSGMRNFLPSVKSWLMINNICRFLLSNRYLSLEGAVPISKIYCLNHIQHLFQQFLFKCRTSVIHESLHSFFALSIQTSLETVFYFAADCYCNWWMPKHKIFFLVCDLKHY